ncbi:DUF7660 family protein [Nocardia rhizosphaerihabitans]|uniref:DUF7660 domain-containing protein n=1 Tax=Nocardia rhizosphaerihabitans TaxID=1691570 RepID=A0ABQ2K9Q0_9NOCA|nr:hypothetical protein [Nocardia rhizosphaerihabitans]GGN75238.1 hypothetical protein GCM10011610_19370 [Nocardia rhizosphaerihabitans]
MAELNYDTVTSRADLVEFIQQLTSLLKTNPEQVENGTLESFLEGSGAWLDDLDLDSEDNLQRMGIPGRPSDWKFVALLIYAGVMYE